MSECRYHAEFASGARAELTLSSRGMTVEWSPALPKLKGRKARRFVAAYQAWRNTCVADFARRAGIRIAVIDL